MGAVACSAGGPAASPASTHPVAVAPPALTTPNTPHIAPCGSGGQQCPGGAAGTAWSPGGLRPRGSCLTTAPLSRATAGSRGGARQRPAARRVWPSDPVLARHRLSPCSAAQLTQKPKLLILPSTTSQMLTALAQLSPALLCHQTLLPPPPTSVSQASPSPSHTPEFPAQPLALGGGVCHTECPSLSFSLSTVDSSLPGFLPLPCPAHPPQGRPPASILPSPPSYLSVCCFFPGARPRAHGGVSLLLPCALGGISLRAALLLPCHLHRPLLPLDVGTYTCQ